MKLILYVVMFFLDGPFGTEEVLVSAMEGDSITLYSDFKGNVTLDFNGTVIAPVNGSLILNLEDETGYLTIKDSRKANSEVYKLNHGTRNNDKNFNISIVQNNSTAMQHEVKKNLVRSWCLNDTLSLEFSRLQTKTGSVTIRNISTSNSSRDGSNAYNSTPKPDEMKKSEGESLDSQDIRKPNYVMKWYFNSTRIVHIAEDPNKTCVDVQFGAHGTYRDRLHMHLTGSSLTIKNIRNTDTGVYKLKIVITNLHFSIQGERKLNVSVTRKQKQENQPQGPLVEICNGVVLMLVLAVAVAAAVVVYRRLHRNYQRTLWNGNDADKPNSIPLRDMRAF